MEKLDFRQWAEMVGTGVVFDPHAKSKDWNWWGAPGSTGVSPKEGPIKNWAKKKKRRKNKKK